jgi:hypothetical protein
VLSTKSVYKQKIDKIAISPSSETFFKEIFNVTYKEFNIVYGIPFKATVYTKLRSFQFKINHNILYTNEKLHRIGLEDSPLCSMCNDKIETLTHRFVDGEKLNRFWESRTKQVF